MIRVLYTVTKLGTMRGQTWNDASKKVEFVDGRRVTLVPDMTTDTRNQTTGYNYDMPTLELCLVNHAEISNYPIGSKHYVTVHPVG